MSIVKFEPVKSSQIREVGHDEKSNTLYIRFRNKKMYTYHPISLKEFNDFKNSESLGKHFHQFIKKKVVVDNGK